MKKLGYELVKIFKYDMSETEGYIRTLALKTVLDETYEPGKTIFDVDDEDINYCKKNKGPNAFICSKMYFIKTNSLRV